MITQSEVTPISPKLTDRLAVSVAEFATLIGVSERSAWTIVKNEAETAMRLGVPSRLPLISPIKKGQTRRLRMTDITAWLEAHEQAA